MSHPMWVRGLKLAVGAHTAHRVRSHPMWVRGLKPPISTRLPLAYVAPYVGAWIETVWRSLCSPRVARRTLCGCVD